VGYRADRSHRSPGDLVAIFRNAHRGMVQHRTRNPHHDLFGGGQLLAVRRNLTRAESVHLCGPTFRLVVITIAVTLTIRF